MSWNKYIVVLSVSLVTTICSASVSMKTPCKEVLSHNSTDWENLFTKAQGDTTINEVNAISRYSACYDHMLGSLEDKLNTQERGPLMGANGDFRDFENAREDLVKKALAINGIDGTLQQIINANAGLYGKQFKYYFLQQYEVKPVLPKVNKAETEKAKKKLADILAQMEKSGKDVKPVKAALATYFVEGIEVNHLPEQQLYEYPIMLLQSMEEPPFSKPPF